MPRGSPREGISGEVPKMQRAGPVQVADDRNMHRGAVRPAARHRPLRNGAPVEPPEVGANTKQTRVRIHENHRFIRK